MKRSTIVFLVLLRMAIGWHFLFEGLDKVRSLWIGPAETNRPFSSAGYFREAQGPLGGWMRKAVGDPDDELTARLVLPPMPAGPLEKPYQYIPPALGKDLDDYAARLTEYYRLDADQQKELATKLQQVKSDMVDWLTANDKTFTTDENEKAKRGVKKVKKTFPTGVVEVEQTLPERRADYLAQLKEVRDTQASKLWLFGKDVEKQRLQKAKADLVQTRTGLQKDLEEKLAEEEKILADVVSKDQLAQAKEDLLEKWGDEDRAKGQVLPPLKEGRLQYWLDRITAWSLTIMGACLLLGLLTRTNCVLLAGFLLMTYLAVPAFPWLPQPPNNEGNYYYVNKNVIEMLALLALATTATGRWFGVDALLHHLWLAIRGEPRQPVTAPSDPFPEHRTHEAMNLTRSLSDGH